MHRLILMAAVVALIFPTMAQADPFYGLYVSAQTGINHPFNEELDFGASGEVEPDWQSAAFGTASVGYQWTNFRGELEVGHRNNSLNSAEFTVPGPPAIGVTSAGNGDFAADGDASMWSAIANFIYDFNSEGRFSPYVGFGIGAAKLDYSDIVSAGALSVADDDTGLAYQLLLGASWKLTAQAAAELRLSVLGLSGFEMTTTNNEMFEVDPLQTSLGVVIRWYFGGGEEEKKK